MGRLHSSFRATRGALPLLVFSLIAVPSVSAATTAEPVFPVPPLGPITLTAPGVTSDTAPVTDVAVNAQGDAVAVWTVYKHGPQMNDDGPLELQAAFRSGPTGPWSAPETILSGGPKTRNAKVGIDATGVATIAWVEYGQGVPSTRVRSATHSAAGLSAIQTVGESAGVWELDLAVSPSGRAVVAYEVSKPIEAGPLQTFGTAVVAAQRHASTGEFATPQTLSSPAGSVTAGGADVAINVQSRAAVTWSETVVTEDLLDREDTRVRLATAAGGAVFGTPIDVSDQPGSAVRSESSPRVVVDPAGSAMVTWNQGPPSSSPTELVPYEVSARRIALDSGVKGPRQVLQAGVSGDSAARGGSGVRLASDASGRITGTWTNHWDVGRLTHGPIYVATAEPGLGFSAPFALTDDARGAQPVLAVDTGGATAVSWAGSAAPITVAWRDAGSDTFSRRLKPSDPWATSIAAAFDAAAQLTLVFARDLAPGYTVQATSSRFKLAIAEPAPLAAPDTVKPVVSIKQVVVAKSPRKKGKNGKKGKKPSARLTATISASEAVTVRAVVSQTRRGIKRGGKCVKRPTNPKRRRGAKTCTRTVVIGPEVGAPIAAAGSTIDLGAAPPAGPYTLTVKGRDAAGNAGDPVTLAFSVR